MSAVPLTAVPLTPAGPDRPLLLVGPSLGTSAAALWGRAAALLADRFRVVGWELPGHGGSPPPTGPVAIADLAAGVLALAGPGRFHYAGDSVGGAVGLQLLLDHPDRVAAATLLCTGARIGTPQSWRERAELVRAGGTAALLDGALERWFAPGFAAREPAAAALLLQALRDADPTGYVRVCAALGAFDLTDRLSEVTAPVLVVAGAHDRVAPVGTGRELAAGLPAASLVILDDVAHQAPLEAPEIVAALIGGQLGPAPAGLAPAEPASVEPASVEPASAESASVDPVHAAGMAVRRAVLGDAYVDGVTAAGGAFTADFQDLVTRYAWGSVWTRPGLDRRSRSLVTLTALVAGGHHEELALHVRAARTNGLTAEEIKEVLVQTAIYCGVPAANTAFRIAARVLSELDGEGPA
jgi:3-oxoadipate enol-lactonase/4-carboxymuconolactone decarboxylase